jgi:hypothetical protein
MKRAFVLFALLAVAVNAAWAGDPLEKLARDFGKKLSTLKNPTVGILAFPYHDGKISSGSSILSERLTTYMADIKNVRVVERMLLKTILEEQHLEGTGLTDASAAQRVGKVLDVAVLVAGTLCDLDDKRTELNARILRSDTGEVLAARRVIVNRVWPDSPHRIHPPTAMSCSPRADDEIEPAPNEAIEIGYPGVHGGGSRPSFRRR